MKRDPAHAAAMDAWVERARRADIWSVLNLVAPHHGVKRRARKGVGPCPACGGKDRFSIDGAKGLFYCRKAQRGGDVIALVEYVTGANFLGACEIITGDPLPARQHDDQVRREDPALIAERKKAAEEDARKRAEDQDIYRQREIDKAAAIWAQGEPLCGTAAETYLRSHRGVEPPPGARLRFHLALKFWHHSEAQKKFVVLHEGPALLARIDDAAHHFTGCHCTYLDLSRPNGKAEIIDPDTGEVLASKKVRGSQRGSHIHLGGDPATATHLVIGEGIETTLSVREALKREARDLAGHLFWAGINLGNLGGRAAESINHPQLTRTDAKGRVRRLKVPGPVPALDEGEASLMPPAAITRVTLLGDGDSDRFTTEQHLRRAAARWAAPGRTLTWAWPGAGKDFNDLIREEAGMEAAA